MGRTPIRRLGWIATVDDAGSGTPIAQGAKTPGDRQIAFDTEIEAVSAVLQLYRLSRFHHMAIHSEIGRAHV